MIHRFPLVSGSSKTIARWLALAALCCLMCLVTRSHITTPDDAFITFRYAENLATGRGFVFNPGERVLATTSPLFALILALLKLLGVQPLEGSFLVSLAAFVICTLLLAAYLWQITGKEWVGYAGATVFIFWPSVLQASVSGMETMLFLALLLGTFVLELRNRPVSAAVVAGLATLTRPEGLLLASAVLAKIVWRDRKRGWVYLCAYASVVTPWVVFAWQYYGWPVPHSVTMKLLLAHAAGARPAVRVLLSDFFYLSTPGHTMPPMLLAVVGVIAALWRREAVLVLIWIVLYLMAYLTARPPLFDWYCVPISLGVFLLSVLGLWSLVTSAPSILKIANGERPSIRKTWYCLCKGTPLMLAALSLVGIAQSDLALWKREAAPDPRVRLGRWIRDNTPPSATLLVDEVGYLAYSSERRTWDMAMLVVGTADWGGPRVRAPHYPPPWITLIQDLRPDYCVFQGSINVLTMMGEGFLGPHR